MLERSSHFRDLIANSPQSSTIHRPETKTVDFQIVVAWLYSGALDLSPVLMRNHDKIWRLANVVVLVRKLDLRGMYMPVARSLMGFANRNHEVEFLDAVELVYARNSATTDFRRLFLEKCVRLFSAPATQPSPGVSRLLAKDGPLAVDILRCRLTARNIVLREAQQNVVAAEGRYLREIQALRQTVRDLESRVVDLQRAQMFRPTPTEIGLSRLNRPGDWTSLDPHRPSTSGIWNMPQSRPASSLWDF